jgi:hypothetical protein
MWKKVDKWDIPNRLTGFVFLFYISIFIYLNMKTLSNQASRNRVSWGTIRVYFSTILKALGGEPA